MGNRTFESRSARYRALYLLLPLANGALLIAGYAFVHGYLGVPEAPTARISGGTVEYLADFLWRASEFLATCMVIYWINLLVVRVVYRGTLFLSARRLLGSPDVSPQWQADAPSYMVADVFAAIPLTFAGYFLTLYSLDTLALWPDTGETTTYAIAFVLSFTFAGTIRPLMALGEQA